MPMIRIALLVGLAGVSYAGDELGAVSSQTVDLDRVVEFGTVSPVEGFTVSGQPDEEALEVFADSGYVAVVDVRGQDENRGLDEAAVVESLGMDYVALPVESRDDLNFENAARLAALLRDYEGPVLVHCGSGNRVGALLALDAYASGADREAAIERGKKGGLTRLESAVSEIIDAAEADQRD